MFKFFRHIRKSLLETNEMGKYIKYAIGEILLVVIGILIALQINNWNEHKKDQRKLHKALISLKKDMVEDSLAIIDDIKATQIEVDRDSLIWKKIQNTETTYDTLIKYFKRDFRAYAAARMNYNKTTFENIKSTGSFELLPDSLRTSLSNYYTFLGYRENIHRLVVDLYIDRLQGFTQEVVSPIEEGSVSPHLYELVWEGVDPRSFTSRFLGLVGMRMTLFSSYRREMNQVLQQTRDQIKMIDSYLEAND